MSEITPKRYVREWLHSHNMSAKELSLKLHHSPSYVATFLAPSGGNPAGILVIDEVVAFPEHIIKSAKNKRARMNKKNSRQRDHTVQQLRTKLIREWKQP